VFWIVDNGSDHRGQRSIDRLPGRWRNLVLVHTPVHASWLNQAEIYHSIIQRKLLDPNDFPDTAALARALNDFERRYNEIATPFEWNFTRHDLAELLDRIDATFRGAPAALAARPRRHFRRQPLSAGGSPPRATSTRERTEGSTVASPTFGIVRRRGQLPRGAIWPVPAHLPAAISHGR